MDDGEPVSSTADLCDAHGDAVSIASPIFRDFGGVSAFGGVVTTVRVLEDNVMVDAVLQEPGAGRVLVVDGGGSLRCALLGDRLAGLASANGWAGIVVHGCVRDTGALARLPIGIKALAAHPRRSRKEGLGERDVPVTFADVTVRPGDVLVADRDGVVVSPLELA